MKNIFCTGVYKPKKEPTYDENVVVKIISQDTPTILRVSFTVNRADTVGLEYLTDYKVCIKVALYDIIKPRLSQNK